MNRKQNVYLAGGMKSGWQNNLIQSYRDQFNFFNPVDHQLSNSYQYTVWDLHFVKNADIIFAYMEKDNPSGYGLSLEIGYGKALNKTIILVDEKSINDSRFAEYFKIIRESASIVFEDIKSGCDYLERFSIYSI